MAHLLGRMVAPFKRTSIGFLDMDRLDAYTTYLDMRERHEQPTQSIIGRLAPTKLLPCQFAMFHRMGFSSSKLDECEWISAFYPKDLALTCSEHHYDSGKQILALFTQKFVNAKWPCASPFLKRQIVKAYSTGDGLIGLAKQHGINDCIFNILGLQLEPLPDSIDSLNEQVRQLVFPPPRLAHLRAKFCKPRLKQSRESVAAMITWTMTSLIGVAWRTFGEDEVREFLDARLFSATCSLKDLFVCEDPLLELTKLLNESSPSTTHHPRFKLLSETGRHSTHSMFVVGVYDGRNDCKLGEGFGPSILVAQKRACIDALQSKYFKEQQQQQQITHHPEIFN